MNNRFIHLTFDSPLDSLNFQDLNFDYAVTNIIHKLKIQLSVVLSFLILFVAYYSSRSLIQSKIQKREEKNSSLELSHNIHHEWQSNPTEWTGWRWTVVNWRQAICSPCVSIDASLSNRENPSNPAEVIDPSAPVFLRR